MLTQQRLKELLDYKRGTGIFTWSNPLKFANVKVGSVAGFLDNGYIRICINGKQYFAHRLAWLYTHGEFPKYEIDHINRIKNDNRIENLRDVIHSINQHNKPIQKNNNHGVTGVYWIKRNKKWKASIMIDRKSIYLGSFKRKQDAIKARKDADKLYGYL